MTLIASDSRPIRSTPVSSPGHRPFGRWMLGLPLYSLTLGYRPPKTFFAVAPDPWPGDPAMGQPPAVRPESVERTGALGGSVG